MTAHELARLLLDGPDLPVHGYAPARDYLRRIIAREITVASPEAVEHCGYHNTDIIAVRDEDDEDGGSRQVIVLR